MGVVTLSALLVAGAGFYLFSKAFPNYQPGMKKLQADLKKLMADLDTILVELIPLSTKELEALSTKQVSYSSKKRITKNSKGAFVTIFEEAAFKYAAREYASKKKDSVIIAKTYKRQYSFLNKGKKVQIVIDEQILGSYDPEIGILTGNRSKKPIAELDRSKPEQYSLRIKGKEMASMLRLEATADKGLSKRVFEYVVDNLTPEQQAIIEALTIYELVSMSN